LSGGGITHKWGVSFALAIAISMDSIVWAVAADCFIVVSVIRHTIIMCHAHHTGIPGGGNIIGQL